MTTGPALPSGWLPTPSQLEQAPELAVLVALDRTLEVAACAVQVAHPEIDDDPECPYWVARADRLIAEKLLVLMDEVRTVIAGYRAALPDPIPTEPVPHTTAAVDRAAASDSDDEIPF